MCRLVPPELFIRNFSTSHSPLQRRLVGRREEEEERPQKRPLISELTTTSFLTTVMDPHRVGEREEAAREME